MRKNREVADPNSCLNKARDDEMLFVLLGRDKTAAATIRHWCVLRVSSGKNQSTDPQIIEAIQCAETIEAEHANAALTEANLIAP